MSQKKQIFKLSILKKFLNDANSCISLVPSTRLLALPPFFLNDMKSGIFYLLNSILKKYDRGLDGIVVGYQNVKILMDQNTGIIPIGSAETEVNVSVEFYIFQPKIGNTLEGVINKKSNNHLGCLVHRYFNATILRPEDVNFNDWNCKDFNVNDKILFKVKDLDFTGLLPYIEGIVSDEELLGCAKPKEVDGSDLDVHEGFQNKILSEHTSPKKKKKKKKEKDDSILKLRKKKEEEKNIFPECTLEKIFHAGSEDEFVKPISSKKEQKKQKNDESCSSQNKIHKDQTQQDELFYSTQIEPSSESKINTSCSPIPKRIGHEDNDKSKMSFLLYETKNRKRKTEDSSDATPAKKIKADQGQINGTVEFIDKLLQQELNKVKEKLKKSKKSKEEKDMEQSASLCEKLMKEVKTELALKKNKDSDSDSTITKKKKKMDRKEHKDQKFKNGSMYDVEITPEETNSHQNLYSDRDLNLQSADKVKDKHVNGVASSQKSLLQIMLDQFFEEEGKKLKNDSDRESLMESTSKQKEKSKLRTPLKVTEKSLYEKLLSDAKSRIEMTEE